MAQETASATTDPIDAAAQQSSEASTAAAPDSSSTQAAPVVPDESPAEDVYDKAFAEILGPDAPAEAAPPEPATEGEPEKPASTEAPAPSQLADDQVQLLKRLHMTPEMIAQWSPEQQQQFLSNAAKREADNTRTFKRLKEQLGEKGGGDGAGDEGTEAGAGQQQTQEAPASSELAKEAQQVVDDLVEVYGEEMKPLGDFTNKLVGVVGQLQQKLEETSGSSGVKDQLIVEMTIDSGVRDLIGDFPTLEKADAREKVVQRFEDEWRSPNSRHRTAQGSLLNRVRAALRDAAAAEFGQVTETAAQVALANKTKERLRSQPQAGSGRGRKGPMTQDDVYDQAFEAHLAPEVRK